MAIQVKLKDCVPAALNALRVTKTFRGAEHFRLGSMLAAIRVQRERMEEAQRDLLEKLGEDGEIYAPARNERGERIPGVGDWKEFDKESRRLQEESFTIDLEPIGIGQNQKDLPDPVAFEFLGQLFRLKDQKEPEKPEKE